MPHGGRGLGPYLRLMQSLPEDTRTTGDDGTEPVGDLDRRLVDERLQRLVGTGHLRLAEYERRAGPLWAAATRAELAAVTTGLPPALEDRGQRVRPPSPVRFAVAFALAASALAWVGSAVLSADQPPPARNDNGLVVPAGQTVFEVGRRAEEVTVIVPDGVRVELSGLDARGFTRCDDACAWPSGPSVKLVGTVLEDVHVMSQQEYDTGHQLSTIVSG